MCGLAGVVCLREGLPPPEEATLLAMAGALRHRGPDEFGLYRDRHAGLAHARLSIIDLASGQQPLANEDRTLWVAFNGEIFNYLELRPELERLGHRFRTRSDTEVIVHAWESWGEEAFARFNGQFAIALWDARRRELILASDRLGVRPLHLCEHEGRLLFASEARAIFAADAGIRRELDPVGLAETFTFWAPLAPRTPFAAVTELEPGHLRRIAAGRVTDRAWWRPSFPGSPAEEFEGTVDEASERVLGALQEAVRLRIVRADVPVGAYLSGGLDSSLIAALGRRAQAGRFCTFSLRFEDAEYDEAPFQRRMVERLETEHREVVVRREDIAGAFPEVVRHAERPLLRTAPAPLYLLSRLVRDAGLRVVLTGEGADEVFAGYDLFREAKVRRFWARQPGSRLRPRLLERLYPYLARSPVANASFARSFFGRGLEGWAEPGFSHSTRWSSTRALQRLFAPGLREALGGEDPSRRLLADLPADFERWSFLARDQYLEMRTLLSSYLLSSQGDRMLMAHSVEGRFPFLDAEVLALAASLPASHKLRVLDEKHVLKRAAGELVPEEILRRRKQPYRAPDALAFTGPALPEWADEVMSERALAQAGVFEPRAARRLWEKCRGRGPDGQFSNSDNMAIVGMLSTQLLYRQFVVERPQPGPPIALRTRVDRTSAE